MFSFFSKQAAKSAGRCIPGLNAVLITADVAAAAWTIYTVGKNFYEETQGSSRR
jgi:hypothetical protein